MRASCFQTASGNIGSTTFSERCEYACGQGGNLDLALDRATLVPE